MLRKEERFTRKDFPLCYKRGIRVSGKLVRIITCPLPSPKASVTVSKKVSQKAVERNTLRRRVYEALRTIPRSGGVIVVLFPDAKNASYEELSRELFSLIKKSSR